MKWHLEHFATGLKFNIKRKKGFDMKRCCIDICTHKQMNDFERKSFKQVIQVLSKYDFKLTVPFSLDISEYEEIAKNHNVKMSIDRIQNIEFTLRNFNSKIISQHWYWKRFEEYEYVLHYELDAWVFSDQLEYWCNQEYDYIGAPWPQLSEVGNSGFSLMKVSKILEITQMDNVVVGFNQNFDFVWCHDHKGLLKVPTVEIAAKFSFELQPSKMYQLIGQKMPFGCHKPLAYEYQTFWKQHIHL